MKIADFSIFLCNWGPQPQQLEDLIAIALHAEQLGFHAVHIPHVPILPYPEERPPHGGMAAFVGERYRHYQYDPLVLVPMLAQATRRIRIGFNIVVTPYLHPYVWAKYMATIDVATNGRFVAGFGLGYAPPKKPITAMQRLGMDSRNRGRMSDEALDMIIRLWTADTPVDFAGEFWKLDGVMVDPKPVQKPWPELWWAGDSAPAIERAARFATYLEALWPPASEIRERYVPALQAANARWGRNTKISDLIFAEVLSHDLSKEEIGKRWYTGFKEDAHAVGRPETVAATIRKLHEAGVAHFALDMHRHGQDHVSLVRGRMDAFANEVVPLLR